MKKIIILTYIFIICLGSTLSLSAQKFVSSVAPQGSTYLTINPQDAIKNFLKEAGSQSLEVETNLALRVKSSDSWCKPKVEADGQTVTISVDENEDETERTAEVTIYGKDNQSVLVEVLQIGTGAAIFVNETSFDFDQFVSKFSLQVTSSLPFSFTLPSWIKGLSITPTIGTHTYEFTLDPINEGESRAGEIKIVSENNAVADITISVTQTHTGYPRFAVISDIHFENNNAEGARVKVPKALKNLVAKDIDALFIAGDLTDYCRESDWSAFKAMFADSTIIPEDVPVYFMMGNHDFYTNSREVCEEKFTENTQQDLHQYLDIKGYPFITLSMSGSSWDSYSDECLQFLETSLEDADENYPGKPIFVFSHVPPRGTVYGSNTNDGNWGTTRFEASLSKYPQVIIFSGHSHYPLGDPRSIYQNLYTAINDGSTTYSEIENGTVNIGIHPENSGYVTEGLVVNLDKDMNVELERWDTYRDEEISPRWYVNAPHDGTAFLYKNKGNTVPPTFSPTDRPEVSDVDESTCKVTFPQASEIESDVVHHYIVEILKGTSVVSTFSKFSQYYMNSATPETLTVSFTTLPANSTLTARVKAVDAYNNNSAPITSEEFTTGKYQPGDGTSKPAPETLLLDVQFNEDGTVEDASPLKNTITTGATAPAVYFNDSFERWGAKFNGSNTSYYKVDYKNNTAIKNAFSNGFSFEAVYMVNNTANTMSPISAQESGGAGLEQKTNFQFWAHVGGGYKTLTSSNSVSANVFYHVVAVYDQNAGKTYLYINGMPAGELAATGAFGFPTNTSAQWIAIGGDASTSATCQSPLNGELLVARMYNKAVDRAEVYWMYEDFKLESPEDPNTIVLPTDFPQEKLAGHWLFDESGVSKVTADDGISLTTSGNITYREEDGIQIAYVANSTSSSATANYLTLAHNLPATDTDGTEVKDYCLVMDIKVNLATPYLPLLWNHFNTGDADIFVKAGGDMGLSVTGFGYTPTGFVQAGWNRIVINANLSAGKLDFYCVYPDGTRKEYKRTEVPSSRFSLRTNAASDIFRDNGNEDGDAGMAQCVLFDAPLTDTELNDLLVPWTE